ncbi:MAG TPA: hypothetical protein VF179_19895, partial [Thermoanaerobaculia bacterium]|nr:hypothetical protein [Thermoanaerobaculia bacterium]
EILKWLGCGEQDPVLNTQDAWRPNRRVELLFVRATTLPCQVPQPDTFNLPAPGAVAGGWCLGPGNPNARCCFLSRGTPAPGQWQVQPAEPGTIIVRGSMRFEDGTPVANTPYVLIAPDGENMDGEGTTAPNRGRPIPGRTALDGAFSYPAKPKGIGVYTLEVQGPFVVRRAGEPPEAAKGNVVCKRLDGSSDFDVIVLPAPGDPSATGSFQVGRLEYTEVQEGTFDLPLPGGGGATFTVRRRAIIRYPADVGGAGAQVSARQAAYPLIVILHGNHRRFRPNGTFVESYRGFDYLASHLASHGYIAISIDVDDINARPDLIFGRGEAILEHIAIMDRRNTTDPQLAGRIDLGTIGLIGHSRGGEGVLAAEQLNVSRGLGLGIRAIVSIAPTNFEDFVHNTTPLLLLYGSSDGDVSGADDGVNPFLIYDRAAPLKAMIFVYAAIHNRFSTNSDWLDPTQIDNDDARRISEADHQNIAKGFSLAFFERHFRAQLGFEPLFKRYGRPGSVAHVELHHQLTDPASLLVDDFDQAGHDATQNTLGNVVTETGLANPDGQAATLVEVSLRRSDTLFFIHNTFGGMIAWDASGGTYTTTLNALDASSFRVLACRVTQRLGSARNPVNLSQDFLVRLNDTSGQSAAVEVGTVTGIPFPFVRHDHNVLHPPALGSTRFVDVLPDHPDLSKSALKTLRIPLSTFKAKNPRIDLASLQTLSFEFQTTATGEIAVDEIEFSN